MSASHVASFHHLLDHGFLVVSELSAYAPQSEHALHRVIERLAQLHGAGGQVLAERLAHVEHGLRGGREDIRADIREGQKHGLAAHDGVVLEHGDL